MANPLFDAIVGHNANRMPERPDHQNPMNMQDAMQQLRSNPAQMIKQAGYNVPDEIMGNPQAVVMHLIQTGQISNPLMQRIQPMLRMMGR